jgi:hypothetical protein
VADQGRVRRQLDNTCEVQIDEVLGFAHQLGDVEASIGNRATVIIVVAQNEVARALGQGRHRRQEAANGGTLRDVAGQDESIGLILDCLVELALNRVGRVVEMDVGCPGDQTQSRGPWVCP